MIESKSIKNLSMQRGWGSKICCISDFAMSPSFGKPNFSKVSFNTWTYILIQQCQAIKTYCKWSMLPSHIAACPIYTCACVFFNSDKCFTARSIKWSWVLPYWMHNNVILYNMTTWSRGDDLVNPMSNWMTMNIHERWSLQPQRDMAALWQALFGSCCLGKNFIIWSKKPTFSKWFNG